MKTIYEVLQQKDADVERLKGELQALSIVAPLLEEELASDVQVAPSAARTYSTPPVQSANGGPGTPPPKKLIWSWGRLKGPSEVPHEQRLGSGRST